MIDEIPKKLIFEAQNDNDVYTILKENNLLDKSLWRPIGGDYGNETLIRHQSPSAALALGERCINSIDSILMRKCIEKGIDPRGSNAPKSMVQATKEFCNVPEGQLGKYEGNLEKICEIYCSATGRTEGKLSINLVDFGEGQTPDYFEHSFLSLPIGKNSPYKQGISFVQGRYNQGGGGSYKFSKYTLIVTRRAPTLLTSASREIIDKSYNDSKISLDEIYKRKDEWSWTIVTKFTRKDENTRTFFGYYAPDGKIPSFKADTLELMPPSSIPQVSSKLSKSKKAIELKKLRKRGTELAYKRAIESGTLVKLFDFPLKSCKNADIWREGQRAIRSQVFYELPIPIKLIELREWGNRMKGTGDAAYLVGLLNSILRYKYGKTKLVRDGWPKTDVETIKELDNSKITIKKWILETERDSTSQAENWLGNNSIVYVLNGQVHAHEETSYLRSLKLYNLTGSLLVAVDINAMPIEIRDKIFRVDRSFMESTYEADILKEVVKSQIIKDEDIKNANDAKLFEQASEIEIDPKRTDKIIQNLCKENPAMTELLQGSQVQLAIGGIKLVKKVGEKYKDKKYGKKSPEFFVLQEKGNNGN